MYLTLVSIIKIVILFIYTCILSIIAGLTLLLPKGDEKYFFFARHWAKHILMTFGIKVRLHGIEKIKNTKGNVYVANHASMFDIWALQSTMPGQLRFVGKKEIVKIPIFGWIWQYSGNIPIDRKHPRAFLKSLDKASQTIADGKCIILYPEGTRTQNGKMQDFKRGTFSVALKSKARIVPVTINGSFPLHKKGSATINPGYIDLVIHEPIEPEVDKITREKELEIMQHVREKISGAYIEQ